MKKSSYFLIPTLLICFSSCAQKVESSTKSNEAIPISTDSSTLKLSDDEWKKKLTAEQYYVTCEGGTERAFTGKYWDFHGDGVYYCVRCGAPLFDSKTKFDSGSGWPSFTNPMNHTGVSEKTDSSNYMIRNEIICSKCGAHLGHVFDDGPAPAGMRYCVNSISLDFKERGK